MGPYQTAAELREFLNEMIERYGGDIPVVIVYDPSAEHDAEPGDILDITGVGYKPGTGVTITGTGDN